MIASIVANPLADERWHEADKPWQFLAACMELVAAAVALDAAQSYRTHLPIAFDGSCSGLQHLCMMTKAPEGSLVNLTANDLPADIYQTVADVVQSRIENDIEAGGDDAHLAKLWLDHGVTRKLVKRNVMTFAYSSKQFGMSQQHMEDTMRPLALEVLKGVYAQHPLGPDGGRAAAKYLARHTYDAICQIVRLPAEAMTFLQTIARGLAHEGKCLSWVTPTGLPCANRYYEMQIQRVRLWMHDTAIRISVADGHSRTVDKASAANAIAPNVVHSLDAAHLCLTANAAKAEGIVTATVHDSFACHAPNASRFRDIIREQLVAMYDNHDVLAEIRQSALSAITSANSHRIPKEIEHGTLDRQQTLRSPFAFA
jgi:DNA-directed RNA polymerase